ncbi:FtsW/RodA/SpoVE family cell cycle protein [Corynebacterium uberis]|uniref:FtsW/RodA/SpoVE family cell cycle protein n=1 Tax=Corynebacterium TaxID=1716 RepID=UPI001D0AE4F1|nr:MULTISPECIES: FtsW/RodA/SpoVE family cell cycle protein [Corynebacterium]MCZ9310121.1 FtsW/RodA/SpoVE family cell cycle protein [Corynebacterium sp. c6VSa_13]UDL73265.1 FtsW/RodA/SpoVE family cell cycle protein [Corynebacterium uberis]UDL75858.1 FtsW/RodA/SpoVE family cell cycle protein [Corynebacterium uberis]UDL78070.1 FtsW/RodA/SpoVE family cell cycle protein [Corynebacterium uberis]UDL80353.1 FtsW/RodA/SpoVE family cell cycle protein [Corynebacterium uberis]
MALLSRKREMGLLILATLIVAALLANLELAQGNALGKEIAWIIGGFILIFSIAHIALCFLAPHADQLLLPITATLNGIGLVIIYRLDLEGGTNMAKRQVMWTVVGIILLISVLAIVREHRSLTRYSYLLGLLGLGLLILPLFFWFSPANEEARIWVSLGPLSVQPGEFSKILLLLFFAQLLVNKRALFTVAGYRFMGLDFPRLRDLAPILAVWGIAILIMAGSNDFGPALLLFTTVLGMLYFATGRASWLLIGTVLVAVGGTAVYTISTKIQARVANFLDPIGNYDGSGLQLSQALFGMSFGGITGTGIGKGYPYIIPVVHSDFILAAVGEELGLIGLSAVVLLFALFVTRGLRVAMEVRDSYGKLAAAGLSLTLAVQVFVVIAGISALMPMTGLTTPFMSQGGSSLMANYVLLGILLRISHSARTPQTPPPGATDGSGQSALNPGVSDDPSGTGLFPQVTAEPPAGRTVRRS